MNRLVIIVLFMVSLGYAQDAIYTEIESKYFNNFHSVNDSIYRSEQPSKMAFKALEAAGIKTILNLRRLRNDTKKAKGTNLQLEHIPLATKSITEDDVIEVLQLIQNAEKPLLIHCWHGSDRTGVMIAANRIVVENWTKEDAIKEFKNAEFGYHEKKYPNLIELLENLNVKNLRKQLNIIY